tara:strand:+ start:39 stop:1880 length:1842 start_codon:yes stop_codon:yes gene_type:complete
MSTYREIHGKPIKSVSTDPSATTDEGQIWYNTTSDTFKSIIASKAFISSASYLSELFGQGGAGTQTSALSFGGAGSPGSTVVTTTGEYDGSGWATGGAMSTARRSMIGFGIQTAALGSTGYSATGNQTATEEYDGSSWTGGGVYPVGQELGSGCGTQTAGLGCGGQPTPNTSNEYNGASWTASPGNLNDGRSFLTTVGTQTAALAAGARSSNPLNKNCEEYDGSTWTSVNSLNTTRDLVSFGAGIQTSAISYGSPGSLESYDGTNWTNESATMGTARNSGSNAGSATAALACGGSPGSATALTEEYNVSSSVTTAGAWASGPSRVNTVTNAAAADGTPSAWLVWGGRGAPSSPPLALTTSEEFNGSAFSNTPSLNTGARDRWGGGSEPAAWAAGGTTPVYTAATEEYNGSSWSSVEDMPAAAAGVGAFGVQTAGIWVVGQISPGPYPNATLSYDGTDWTSGPALNTARINQGGGAVGIATAGVLASGESAPGSVLLNAEEWGGSSWTSVNSMITGTGGNSDGAFGTQTAAIYAGGNSTSSPNNGVTAAQAYDGTTWSTSPSLGQARKYCSEGGTNTAGLITSGQATNEASALSSSEQWTPESTSINVKTLTQS